MEENQKTGVFEDNDGNNSWMRVASSVALLNAIFVSAILVLKPLSDPTTGLVVFGGWLIAAFTPKALQKFAEMKIPKA